MITKYGYSTFAVIIVTVLFLLLSVFLVNNNIYTTVISLISIAILLFSLNFFRDPERKSPGKIDAIVTPADGKVLLIKEVEENKYINGKGTQVSVFMSPLNVHVNRIPVDGVVEYIKYCKGKYLVAFDDKASEENERSEIGINGKNGKVFFTQVAGYIARRIVYELKEGDNVKQGERFGMIKFGSRVDVVVPFGWQVKVKKGDKVTAGESILFELTSKQ